MHKFTIETHLRAYTNQHKNWQANFKSKECFPAQFSFALQYFYLILFAQDIRVQVC